MTTTSEALRVEHSVPPAFFHLIRHQGRVLGGAAAWPMTLILQQVTAPFPEWRAASGRALSCRCALDSLSSCR